MKKIGANNRLRQELIVKQNTEKIGYERAVSDLKKSEEQLELIRIEGMRIEEDKDKLKGDYGTALAVEFRRAKTRQRILMKR